MSTYHDTTALLAWLTAFEQEGRGGPLEVTTRAIVQEIRAKLDGSEVSAANVLPDVWEIQDIPADRRRVWIADQDTGEAVAFVAVPMFPDRSITLYGRLWHRAGFGNTGGRFTDHELLGFGPVYGYDFDRQEVPS